MTAETIFDTLRVKLARVAPEAELRYKAEIAADILRLKEERNAVILGHNYMEPALFHTVPDYTGDSLALSRRAAETNKPIIVFCGVRFMAETAKLLSPDKTVLLPSEEAGCSLAESIAADDVRWLRRLFPDAPVVSYVNTYAHVKAESDICCTSSNAAEVIESLNSDVVIYVPDEYMARNAARETGRNIMFPSRSDDPTVLRATLKGPTIIGWPGRCVVHEQYTTDDIENVRMQFPNVAILSHPECSPDVVQQSDFTGGTSAMIRFVEESSAPHFLLLTECSMGDNIMAAHPEKDMLRLCSVRCPYMNEITLEDTREALLHNQYQIEIPEEVAARARDAVKRMISIGRGSNESDD